MLNNIEHWMAFHTLRFWYSCDFTKNCNQKQMIGSNQSFHKSYLAFYFISYFLLFAYCLYLWSMHELVCCQGLLNKGPRVKFIIGCQPCPCQFWQNRENAKSCWYKIAKWVFYARELLLLVDYKQNKYKIVPQISYFLFRSEKLWWCLPRLMLCLHVS